MGWTFQARSAGMSHNEFFTPLLTPFEVVASNTTRNTYIAAVRDPESGIVEPFVALVTWAPRDAFNFGYKDVPAEPGYAHGSRAVIDALTSETPRTLLWKEWSERRLAQRAMMRAAREGDTIMLRSPMRFSDGADVQSFVLRKMPRGKQSRLMACDAAHPMRVYQFPWREAAVQYVVHTDGTIDTSPHDEYAGEDAYVATVLKAFWANYPKAEDAMQAFKERYGSTDTTAIEWFARMEYRDGDAWQDVPAA